MKKMLKIGLLLDTPEVPQLLVDFISQCQKSDLLSFTCAIVIKSVQQTATQQPLAFQPMPIILWHEQFLLRHPAQKNAFVSSDVTQVIPKLIDWPVLENPVNPESHSLDEFDLLLQLGTAEVPFDLARQARLGIFALSDNQGRNLIATPAGMDEVTNQNAASCFGILHESSSGQPCRLILEASAATQLFFAQNRIVLLRKALALLKVLLVRIAHGQEIPAGRELASQSLEYRTASKIKISQIMKYLISSVTFGLALFGRHILLGKRYRWQAAFTRQTWPGFKPDPDQIKRLPNQDHQFQADPFIIHENGRDYCFIEQLDYRKGKGVLSAYDITGETPIHLGVVLEEPFHLSYPFLFRYNEAIYLCPETSASREIRLYKAIDFPMVWKLEKILIRDIAAVDSMLFEHGGIWWLLTNIDSTNSNEFSSELYLFSATQPITDDWRPHPMNPIVFDAHVARNGGLIQRDGMIYRVAQQMEFFRYGTGTTVFQIDRLSLTDYNESRAAVLLPSFFAPTTAEQTIVGHHHMASDGQITVFDYCRLTRIKDRQ